MRHEVMLCLSLLWHGIFFSRPGLDFKGQGIGSIAAVFQRQTWRALEHTRGPLPELTDSEKKITDINMFPSSGGSLICSVPALWLLRRCHLLCPTALSSWIRSNQN